MPNKNKASDSKCNHWLSHPDPAERVAGDGEQYCVFCFKTLQEIFQEIRIETLRRILPEGDINFSKYHRDLIILKAKSEFNITLGCDLCRPSFIGCITDKEANNMKKRLKEFKQKFNRDFDKKFKKLMD